MRIGHLMQPLWLLYVTPTQLSAFSLDHDQIALQDHVVADTTPSTVVDEQQRTSKSRNQDLSQLREKYKVPALLAASSLGGDNAHKQVQINVTGVRRQGTSTLATVQDQWHLGSLTKAMTATLLALLVKAGHFSWSTPISTIILKSSHLRPILPFINAAFLRMPLGAFLSHRAGISINLQTNARLMVHLWASDAEQKTIDDRLMLTKLALSSPPANETGTFVYDNLNYVIAGAIVDAYSPQKSWEAFILEALFDPLGMSRCGFGPNPETSWFSVSNPWPHLWGPRHLPFTDGTSAPVPVAWVPVRLRDNPPAMSSAGTVHCPTESYAAFLRLHASRGLLTRNGAAGAAGGNPLEPGPVLPFPPNTVVNLSPSEFDVLHTPIYYSPIDETGENGDASYYTLGGWIVPASAFIPAPGEPGHPGKSPVYPGDLRAPKAPILRNSSYRLSHEGSNTMNDAMAWVDVKRDGGRGSGEFRFAATNAGGMSELLDIVLKGMI